MKLFNKIFKSNKNTEPVALTTITRTEILEGFSIPGIIHNIQYHYNDLQVYSDGLISCWGMVDLPMFKKKLDQGWVVTSIPDGEAVSIFNLGHWYIEQGEWQYTKETLYEFVNSLVKRLNPTLENLHNYKEDNSNILVKVYPAKHFNPDPKPYYYDAPDSFFPKKINGEKFQIFFRNDDDKTYLVELSLYKSGYIEITNLPVKKTFKFDELNELADKEIITTDLKVGEIVTILNLGSFKIKSGSGLGIKFKLNELTDKFNELNGRENSILKCKRILKSINKTQQRS